MPQLLNHIFERVQSCFIIIKNALVFDALSKFFFNKHRLFEGDFGLYKLFSLNDVFLVYFPLTLKIFHFTSIAYVSASY